MNLYDQYYNRLAEKLGLDIDDVKFFIRLYIANLKVEIEESEDEFRKELWRNEFGEDQYPTTDDFLTTLFIFGKNPFIPNKQPPTPKT